MREKEKFISGERKHTGKKRHSKPISGIRDTNTSRNEWTWKNKKFGLLAEAVEEEDLDGYPTTF